MRILIANRGEIARRVIRTAHRLGNETVAVFAEPDRDAPFVSDATLAVCIGPAELAKSYLSIERILDAADRTGATAVHPGYGFLSENTEFARAVVDAGLVWIGPHAEAVERMGSKIEARRIAADTGVPIIPGFDESQDPADLAAAAERIGFPVLVKAAAGGGGKGIRIVHDAAGFSEALDEAMTEAERSFGDRAMIVERYIQRPRHVEVQVVGDRHGNVIDLGTRECSVQRRYQKLLEEAPAPNLPDATRSGLRASATELASAMRYDSAGTVEFIVDDETGD
jgi:3-methylcrotonyl-CoA carboxylase alpha subunit